MNLVNFMIYFEMAIENQSHNQSVFDFQDTEKYPRLPTILTVEVNAYKKYTRLIFHVVQKEIKH